MSTTLHRKDMSKADFDLLALFSWLYITADPTRSNMYFGKSYLLGEVTMLLPVWFLTASGWKIANIKPFVRDAVGIETSSLRKMCRFLRVSEHALVDTLFRFSMLAFVPGQKYNQPPRFRMPFSSIIKVKGFEGYATLCDGVGFVIERRRLEGNFKSGVENDQ